MSTFVTAELPSDDSGSDFDPGEEEHTREVVHLPAKPSDRAMETLADLKAESSMTVDCAAERTPERLKQEAAEAAARVLQTLKRAEEESKKEVEVKFAGEVFKTMGVKRPRGNEKFEDVVKEITRKKTLNSMSKSQLDWECYKDKEKLEDGLAVNRKDGFVNKSRFLVESIAKEKEHLKKKRRGPLD